MCILAVFLVNSATCTTDFSDFYLLLQERGLLYLPGSATCTTDFSDFYLFLQERGLLYLPGLATCTTDFPVVTPISSLSIFGDSLLCSDVATCKTGFPSFLVTVMDKNRILISCKKQIVKTCEVPHKKPIRFFRN